MTGERKQFNARANEDLVERIRSLDRSNGDILQDALEMYLRAHGEDSEQSLRREVREIDDDIASIRAEAHREMDRIRREALDKIGEKQARRDELTELLARQQSNKAQYQDKVASIARELDSNQNKNILAFRSDIRDLVARRAGAETRDGVVEDVREYAYENDLTVLPSQLAAGQGAEAYTADGEGKDSPIDTSRYEFDNDD